MQFRILGYSQMNVVLGDLKTKVNNGMFLPPKSNMCPKKENVRKIYQKASVNESVVSCPSGSLLYNLDDGNGWMCESSPYFSGNHDCRKAAGNQKGLYLSRNENKWKCVDPSTVP